MATAPGLAERARRNLFWLISRVGMACYRRVPVFGPLRASIGILRDGDRVLVIRRNDGRGLSFPGGLAHPRESEESALIREVQEETGLRVLSCTFAFRYESSEEIPVRIAVFHTQTEGEMRASWEGTPAWVELADAQHTIMGSQKYAVEQLLQGQDVRQS
jgi:8-oxo-dGTP pyrophosphatase MutT (NUDIX family)